MKHSFLGAFSFALALASCTPSYAAEDPSACVAPDQIAAVDQAALDTTPGFEGYKSVVIGTLEGDTAKAAGLFLMGVGAPREFAEADVIVILNAIPGEGQEAMSNRHVVAFRDGCKTGGGFIAKQLAEQLLGSPA